MIERYMNDLDVLISASPSIVDIDIIRRDIRDTGLEKTALFRYRIKLLAMAVETTLKRKRSGNIFNTDFLRIRAQRANLFARKSFNPVFHSCSMPFKYL